MKVFHIEFQQNVGNGLWDTWQIQCMYIHMYGYTKLYYIWINMAEK
jgi:hypothetical protein